MVGVSVGNDDVSHATNLDRSQCESDAPAVNRDKIVDHKGSQTLKLRLAPRTARQKSDSHSITSVVRLSRFKDQSVDQYLSLIPP
jgi:hypothetical protein